MKRLCGPFLARTLLFSLLFCSSASGTRADKLEITSHPSGATVELDGVPVGVTPFEADLPGGYFHRTLTSIGKRLEHPMVARVSLAGYATKEIPLSQGPIEWIGLNGRHHGEYWLLKTNHFHAELDLISEVFTGTIFAKTATPRIDTGTANRGDERIDDLSIESIVAKAKPAVVYLKGSAKAGTGFFVTETGLIATNAHLARGEESLLARMSNGVELNATVEHVDQDFDVALLKIPGNGFPRLTLADISSVRQGQNVIAIGNPGDAMLFSVTKGIVSGIGVLANAGPGTWIQTDAPLNAGSSGGPLLNAKGEVIGVSTQKPAKKNVSGIAFALSASDLLFVLHQFYTNENKSNEGLAAPTEEQDVPEKLAAPIEKPKKSAGSHPKGFGIVSIPEPDGGNIWIDKQLVGQAPAKFRLTAETHRIVIQLSQGIYDPHDVVVPKDGEISVKPRSWPKLGQ